jgi:hypothetical protein
MDPETGWGDDTVSLGRRNAAGSDSEEVVGEESRKALDTNVTGANAASGGETMTFNRTGGGALASFSSGRRRALSLAAGAALILLALALTNVIGNGRGPMQEPRGSGVTRKAADRRSPAIVIRTKDDQPRRFDPKVRAAEQKRSLRRRLQWRRGVTRAGAQPRLTSTPEPEAEYVPEYSPELVPERPPAPEAAPSASGIPPTPPGVEFGM